MQFESELVVHSCISWLRTNLDGAQMTICVAGVTADVFTCKVGVLPPVQSL